MKRLLILIQTLGLSFAIHSQVWVLHDPISSRTFSSEKYAGIKGSPFLFDKWVQGSASVDSGTYNNLELKLDAYSNTLYFNKGDEPYEFQASVRKFVLMPNVGDSSTYQYYRKGLSGAGLKNDQYVQVLAEGNISLYRSDIKLLSEVNEINAGVVKTFNTSTRYYLKKGDAISAIKLNKKDIMSAVADKEKEVQAYINQYKIGTKKESDLVAIINYYNSL